MYFTVDCNSDQLPKMAAIILFILLAPSAACLSMFLQLTADKPHVAHK